MTPPGVDEQRQADSECGGGGGSAVLCKSNDGFEQTSRELHVSHDHTLAVSFELCDLAVLKSDCVTVVTGCLCMCCA